MKVIKYPRPNPGDGITYIGRPSIFGNPFFLKNEIQRTEVIAKFEHYARNNVTLLQAIFDLPEDAILGCYCKPKDCHGDVIVKLWKEMHDMQDQEVARCNLET